MSTGFNTWQCDLCRVQGEGETSTHLKSVEHLTRELEWREACIVRAREDLDHQISLRGNAVRRLAEAKRATKEGSK